MPARKIADILGEASELGSIAKITGQVARLQRVYVNAVPPELAQSSRVGWARGDILYVIADNGATAAKLRQIPSRVLDRLRQSGFEFSSIRIEVQVGRSLPSGGYRRTKVLSNQALSAIDGALANLPESPLREALARLARRR